MSVCTGQSSVPHTRGGKAEGTTQPGFGTKLNDHWYAVVLMLRHLIPQAEIIKDPARFVERDPAMARTLIDQREAVRSWHARDEVTTLPQKEIGQAAETGAGQAQNLLDLIVGEDAALDHQQ